MAARQIVQVVQCRVADLKIGDVVRDRNGGWFPVEKLGPPAPGTPGVLTFIQRPRGGGFSREIWDLVDLQLTTTAYSNAPRQVDVDLPGDEPFCNHDAAAVSGGICECGESVSASAVYEWDDEGGEVEVTIYRSNKDGAAVVEIDTSFEPDGSEGSCIRVNVNDDYIWGKEYPQEPS